MGRLESSVPGLPYPAGRDGGLRTGTQWLNGKKEGDGAEGLWRVGDKLYDLEKWSKNHPGGREWIDLTKGSDITEAFEAHHITMAAEKLLPKFYIRDAKAPRASPFTFKPEGFYRTFKARAREVLKDVDIHKPSTKTNLIADSLAASMFALCLIAAATQSWIAIVLGAMCVAWITIVAHNYIHLKNNFRMCYIEFSMMSSREWRITHVLSHHLFANTVWDHEVSTWEPIIQWLPVKDKPFLPRYMAPFYIFIVFFIFYFLAAFKRIYTVFVEIKRADLRDLLPFLLPLVMCTTAPTPYVAIVTWVKIIIVASFHFTFVGYNAAHHHPDIFHDGDPYRDDMDWGLAVLEAVRDREDIDNSLFLTLTNYGAHCLHHLLPTVDHDYLPLCEPIFQQTCKEFGINSDKWTQWELIKGQFKQLGRVEPKNNSR